MQRHHSLGTATLVALMAAHRMSDRCCAAAPGAIPGGETPRILNTLEDNAAIRHDPPSRIGTVRPIVTLRPLRH
jgi:hypothetical protein